MGLDLHAKLMTMMKKENLDISDAFLIGESYVNASVYYGKTQLTAREDEEEHGTPGLLTSEIG